jgi:hypothetical protein
MPFINGEELKALRDSKTELEGRVAQLEGQVAVAATVDRISVDVRQIIESPEFQLPLHQDAVAMARSAVVAEERGRLTTELTDSLKRTHYDTYAAQFRASKGDEIREGLDELFQQDGTYASIREQAENDTIVALQEEVVASEEARVRAELGTPEEVATQKAKIAERLRVEGSLDDYRLRVRAELEEQWAAEVQDAVRAEVVVEERAREEDFVASIIEGIKGSDWIARHRRETRNNLEREWKEKTDQEIADRVGDEELQSLIAERSALVKEQLEREIRSKKLLTNFESKGIDVSELVEGDVVTVYLGDKTVLEVIEDGRWINAPAARCYRILTLCSLGDGTFTVDGDSLLESDSIVEREKAALHRGTVITIGRKVTKDGESSLEQVLRADVPLYYDDDTTDDEIQDSLFTVCEVKLNGVYARGLKHYEMIQANMSTKKDK